VFSRILQGHSRDSTRLLLGFYGNLWGFHRYSTGIRKEFVVGTLGDYIKSLKGFYRGSIRILQNFPEDSRGILYGFDKVSSGIYWNSIRILQGFC